MKRNVLYSSNSNSNKNSVDGGNRSSQSSSSATTGTGTTGSNSSHHPQTATSDVGGNGPFVPLEDTLNYYHNNNSNNSNNGNTPTTMTTGSAATTTGSTAIGNSSLQQRSSPSASTTKSLKVQTDATPQTTNINMTSHPPTGISPKNNTSSSSSSVSSSTAVIMNHLRRNSRMIASSVSASLSSSSATSKSISTFLTTTITTLRSKKLDPKKIISSTVFTLLFLLISDSLLSSPQHRIVQPNFANDFLLWVQDHPSSGLIWILLVMSLAVICMIPIGTPLTLGCGYIYKGAYGWQLGVFIATCVSMLGSALGAVICFLLGRYMMRDMVKKWIRKYPIFDAIDIAAAEHGLRIMAMLYLTPILPLGPVSYMCGTTSLKLSHFIIAKIAALPLMMLYVLIGASTGTLISTGTNHDVVDGNSNKSNSNDIENNETLIISGILLSFASIAGITHYIKKELNLILERQKRELETKGQPDMTGTNTNSSSSGIELIKSDYTTTSLTIRDVETGTTKLDTNIIMLDSYNNTNNTNSNNGISNSNAASDSSAAAIATITPMKAMTNSGTTLSESGNVTTTAPRQRKH